MDLKALLEAISEEELVELTRSLIRIPSVYKPGVSGEEEMALFVADHIKGFGLEPVVEEVEPGRPNVFVHLTGAYPGRTLLLEAHTDVVTEGDPSAWKHPPFEGIVEKGRIYGRGAADTKGNLAAALIALKALASQRQALRGSVLLCCPVDEEGMMLGIKHFIQAGHAKGVDGALILEPEENHICITQKGAMRATVKITGKMAHGAMPQSGINPITRAARVVSRVEEVEKEQRDVYGKHPHLGWPTFTPTILLSPPSGDPQINVMPAEAFIAFDIRTIPGQTKEQLETCLRGILVDESTKDPHFHADLGILDWRPCTETPMEEPLVKAASEAVTMVTGGRPQYDGVPGATDGTFLHAWANIPIVTTGAGGRLVPHQVDEYVEIKELLDACQIFTLTAALYLK